MDAFGGGVGGWVDGGRPGLIGGEAWVGGWVPFEQNHAVSAPQTTPIARPFRAGAIYMSLHQRRLYGPAHRSRRLDGFMGRGGATVTPTGIIPCKTYRGMV